MVWPIDDLTAVHLDAGTDDPKQARPELLSAVNKFKTVLGDPAITEVATIAALKALTIPASSIAVNVHGYSARGDGGGGLFWWDSASSTTDNGGTIIRPDSAPANGRWRRLYSGSLSVKWFGAKGDGIANDTSEIQKTINALQNVGGVVFFPAGTYLVSNLDLYGGISLIGDGHQYAKLKDSSGSTYVLSVNQGSGGTTNVANNQRNINISGLHFEGSVSSLGFSEHVHLTNFNAVSDVHIHDCKFSGWRGDGIYIGSSNVGGVERHNERFTIRKCLFDGVNSDNRNAISIVDCNVALIEDCHFSNCSRSNMPGAVDIEPDANTFHVVRNITIRKNNLVNIGGNVGAICMVLPTKTFTTPPFGFSIDDNFIDSGTTPGIGLQSAGNAAESVYNMGIVIKNNRIKETGRGITLSGLKGVLFEGNSILQTVNEPLLGFSDGTQKNMDVQVNGNMFWRLSYTGGGGGLTIFDASRILVKDNTFIDCGKSDATNGSAISFGSGNSDSISLVGNKIASPSAITTIAISKAGTHTFSPDTNIYKDNKLIGVSGNQFDATGKDSKDWLIMDSYDTSRLPDSFSAGESLSIVNGDTNLPSVDKQGMLRTNRPNESVADSGFRKFIIQWYYPANNNATTLADMYFRKALDGSNGWSAWKKLTGV